MSEYRVDEAFGPVPLWLLRTKVSDRAIRLYALLSALRDYDSNMATVGRKYLSSELDCSLDSLDRAKAELKGVGAITVERAPSSNGEIGQNVYTIHRSNPAAGSRTRAVQVAATIPLVAAPVRPDYLLPDERTSSSSKSTRKRSGRAPTRVNGKNVTPDEEQFAITVLGIFNEISGRKFGSKEALGKIVLRHREHPELDIERHRGIITQQFEHPWWKGDPSPSVIYGNGDVFDRALNGVRGNGHDVGDGGTEEPDQYLAYALRQAEKTRAKIEGREAEGLDGDAG